MELEELLELLKGEKAVIKSKVESILLERFVGDNGALVCSILENFDEDIIQAIEVVHESGLAKGFINDKSRKFRIWRNRTFRKLRRFFG